MADASGDGDTKSFIKSKWIANQMCERAKDFTTLSDITVVSGTWNINGKVRECIYFLVKAYSSELWFCSILSLRSVVAVSVSRT